MKLRTQLVLTSAVALLAVLGSARVALAGECALDDDCGHGFECFTIMGGTGGAGGGTAGSGASVGGSSSGGASAGMAAAGTSGFAPPREVICGDGLCQTPETAELCALDCANTVCVLARCESADDCAEGYECEDEPLAGTGGAAGSTCGDGLCTSGETAESCAMDCTATRRCTPDGGICSSDAQCADGFYCSFMGSGAGGGSASGSTGAGGFAGTSGSSGGGAVPATGGASTGGTGSSVGGSSSGGTTGGTGAGDAALAAGTCMPREDGTGGVPGSGGTVGSGGAVPAGAGGVGTGGTGGTGVGGSGALGSGGSVTTGGAGGSAGTDNGGTGGSGTGGGTGGSMGGATGSGGSATGGTATGTGGSDDDGEASGVERGGCSIAVPHGRSSFSELGALLLVALSVLGRRRRG